MHPIYDPLRIKKLHIILLAVLTVLLSSCNINRFVPEGKYLVQKNKVVVENEYKEVTSTGLSQYITQKPYKNFWETNFKTWVYFKAERNPKSKFWQWMNKRFGREPVFYEKIGADNSAKQMMRHLDNVGYFHSKVTHTVQTRRRKATVTYHVLPQRPYTVNEVVYDIGDSLMERYIMFDTTSLLLHKGLIYNAYDMNSQRDLITERLRNVGYYFFNRDIIHYEVDSNFMNHTLKVTMHVHDDKLAHEIYKINKISVYPEFSLNRMTEKPADSALVKVELGRRRTPNTLHCYHFGNPKVKPKTYAPSIQIIEGGPYRLRSVTTTYEALSNYKIFSNVNIEFDTVPSQGDSLHLLDCRITMQQVNRHAFTFQTEGTRSDADLGIKASLSYSNKNIFRGAELFQLSLKYGLEAQNRIDYSNGSGEGVRRIFNTQELGVTASLQFPRFLNFFRLTNYYINSQPSTTIALGYNMQLRYYYSRYISSATFSYDWKSNYKLSHTLTPINLNSVKIDNIDPFFMTFLEEETNQRKKDQYTNHLIFGARYALVYNSQSIRKTGSFFYLRFDLESSGNLLSLFNHTKLITENEGYHELFGIRYAQYLRSCFDIRQHIDLGEDKWLVFREFIGLGLPYGNSYDLPFERSFYAGGSNGLRGWVYRGVGPGGYVPTEEDIEKIGDMQLEMNAEFRFPIRSILNGAVFFDAGNIWTYMPNEYMPNSEFKFDSFYKQIAMDAGFGLRIDLSFLILRLDLAYALRNPYVGENGSYWRFKGYGLNNLKLCWGIGYPF